MSYCSNCGNELKKSAKFCPECGTKNSSKLGDEPKKPTNMEKGVVKGLKDNVEEFAESSFKEILKPKSKSGLAPLDNQDFADDYEPYEVGQEAEFEPTSAKKSGSRNSMAFYIILTIILGSFAQGNDVIMGIVGYSVIVFIVMLFRYRKAKVFNWLLIILLALQLVLIISELIPIIMYSEFEFPAVVIPGIMIGLGLTILYMIFLGNKK